MENNSVSTAVEFNEKVESPSVIPIMTVDEKREAESFGRSQGLLDKITMDYARLGVAGETSNCLLCYLASVSRLQNEPINVLTISSSGAGKSHLQTKTLQLAPEEDVVKLSSMSDKSLFYKESDSLKHKILALEEAAGMKDSYAVRTLITEGHLTIETAFGGGIKKNTVEGPVSAFMTTTDPEINAETRSRFFVIGIDESKEQTRRILEQQRQAQTLEGMIERAHVDAILRRHHNFQRLLKPYKVVNPYANILFYSDDRLQARRDQPKFLRLCNAVAFLRQMQKEVKRYEDDVLSFKYIEVDKEDIRMATELALEVLGASLDNLSVPARDLLRELDKWAPKGKERMNFTFTRRELMKQTGWTKTRLHIHLKELLDMELAVKESGKQNSLQHYRLLYDGDMTDNRFLIGLNCS